MWDMFDNYLKSYLLKNQKFQNGANELILFWEKINMIWYFSNERLNKIIGKIEWYLLLYNYCLRLFFKLDFVFVCKL
jgi:hypothetical protein